MPFDFQKVKATARRAVHNTLAVQAYYQDASMSAPIPVKARYHTKLIRGGDLDNSGYAEVIEGVDKVVFAASDARKFGFKTGGTITFSSGAGGFGVSMGSAFGGEETGSAVFILRSREPNTGPFEEVWDVTRK